jgi:hypothetical protein
MKIQISWWLALKYSNFLENASIGKQYFWFVHQHTWSISLDQGCISNSSYMIIVNNKVFQSQAS